MVQLRNIFNRMILFVSILVVFCMVDKFWHPIKSVYPIHKSKGNISVENRPVFIIIICNDGGKLLTTSFKRQLDQVSVLLKSAAALTHETLRFLVVTNSETAFKRVKSIPKEWPAKYKSRIELESRDVWYPSDRKNMKGFLRPCSSARLFLPETMNDVEAAVLIDTDTIFLKPPEELFKESYKFNESQALGLAKTSRNYRGRSIPYPEPRGVNTGVMVMNLTRLRSLPGGWSSTTLRAFDEYKKELSHTVTNDIINIALAQNLQILYDLDCTWNFSTGICLSGYNACPEGETTGIHLLHGANAAFFGDKRPTFHVVFEAWRNFELGSSLPKLMKNINARLKADTSMCPFTIK